jgi:hypothetical protein
MGTFVNTELLTNPLNWVVVFLILYFLALVTQYTASNLNAAGITLL